MTTELHFFGFYIRTNRTGFFLSLVLGFAFSVFLHSSMGFPQFVSFCSLNYALAVYYWFCVPFALLLQFKKHLSCRT